MSTYPSTDPPGLDVSERSLSSRRDSDRMAPSNSSVAARVATYCHSLEGGANHGRTAAHQLRAAGGDDARDAGGDGTLRARGDAAAGEHRDPRARSSGVLVLRKLLERPVP